MATFRAIGPFRAATFAPFAVAVMGAALLVVAPAQAAQGPVGLGTATSFAVLAGSGITNTGPTTITGDIGTFPTPSETGFQSLTFTGTNHGGDAVARGAKSDLVTAYNDAAGRTPVTELPVELGGSTLLAGVYKSPTFGLTGTLTLDAQGNAGAEFVFKAGSTLITASNSRVLLLNGADPCHVVWQVGSSATFNTGTQFVGDVLADISITAQTGATFQGRLLARDGAVTLDTNTITMANCVTSVTPGTTSTTVGTTATTTGPVASPPPTAPPVTAGGTSGGPPPTAPPVTPGGTSGGPPPGAPAVPPAGPPFATPSGTPVGTPGGTPTGTPAGTPSGIPTGTPGGTPGPTPTGSPGVPPAGTPHTGSPPPFLAFTGLQIAGLIGTALALLGLGGAALAAGRRRRDALAAPR